MGILAFSEIYFTSPTVDRVSFIDCSFLFNINIKHLDASSYFIKGKEGSSWVFYGWHRHWSVYYVQIFEKKLEQCLVSYVLQFIEFNIYVRVLVHFSFSRRENKPLSSRVRVILSATHLGMRKKTEIVKNNLSPRQNIKWNINCDGYFVFRSWSFSSKFPCKKFTQPRP